MNALIKLYNITKHIFKNFTHKHKVSLNNPRGGATIWHIFISPMNFTLFFMVFSLLLFIINLSIIIYTPIIDTLPGYRNIKSKEMIISAVMRIDSLENEIAIWDSYRDNIIRIMDGKAPIPLDTPAQLDTAALTYRDVVPRSREDSLFRSEISDSLITAKENKLRNEAKSSYKLYTPVQGIVTKQYNIADDFRAIEVSVTAFSPILSIERGKVIFTSWSPEEGNIIQIQHGDGMISIYKKLSQSIKSVGENVSAGEVLGYIGEKLSDKDKEVPETDTKTSSTLKIEIWKEGNSINPENYLSF